MGKAVWLLSVLLVGSQNEEPNGGLVRSTPPALEDAALNDIFFGNASHGCAVGESGAILITRDGGATWQWKRSPVDGLHQSVWFVGATTGWIAGVRTRPDSGTGTGYVLATEDGGETWRIVAGETATRGPALQQGLEGSAALADSGEVTSAPSRQLPRLFSIRFFTKRLGIVAGQSNRFFPSGVARTTDGGRTWEPVAGAGGDWRCAWFLHPETGSLGGRLTSRGALQGQQIVAPRNALPGLQTWRDVRLNGAGTSWIVGDGGSMQVSTDAGVTWRESPGALPRDLADFVDFRAVSTAGAHVWIGGSPGSVIWHSADHGATWRSQPTTHTAPINAIRFSSDQVGWAAGELGTILRTVDGGETWECVRGRDHRLALLTVGPRVLRVPFELLAGQSAELGYRSAVLLPARPDFGPDGFAHTDTAIRLREAARLAGGSAADIEWRFPISIPGIDRRYDQLIEDWQQRTEGRLPQVLVSTLVARLRTWRPDVVVLDEVAPNDAVARVLNEAMLQAIGRAGDPAQFVMQQRLAHLPPWRVRRVYQRLPEGSMAQASVDPWEFLPRQSATVRDVAAPAVTVATGRFPGLSGRQSYRRVYLDNENETEPAGTFFAGLRIAPGTASRRRLTTIDETTLEEERTLAVRRRNFESYAQRYLSDPRHAGQLPGQLREITAGLSDEQAAAQLRQLADRYAGVEKWKLSAAVLEELVARFPETTHASAARQWLFHWWTGVEPMWQRLRNDQVGGDRRRFGERDGGLPAPQSTIQLAAGTRTQAEAQLRQDRLTRWSESANRVAGQLRGADPMRYRQPEMQFALAALVRRRGLAAANNVYAANVDQGTHWKLTAESELWLNRPAGEPPKTLQLIKRAEQKPVLDGILSDACWQSATEMWIRSDANASEDSFVSMAWDEDYLYLAAAVRKHQAGLDVAPQPRGRSYDADLSQYDRLTWYLDLDRDYATWYTLEIDQRGWTRDGCWVDQSWNPQWSVAIDADESHWRIEAAIPFNELTNGPPASRSVWAVGVSRTIPGYGVAGWTHPASSVPRPSTFGLVRFE